MVWRWYDAVVTGRSAGGVDLCEPAHGGVPAQQRFQDQRLPPGSRAYASAGLPGADWCVAGPAVALAEDAEVDVDEVSNFFTTHDLSDAGM